MMTVSVENIWQEFSAKLRQFIRGRVHDDATADDILQDIFLKIQTRLGQLEDSSKLQGWIFLMARNAIIDQIIGLNFDKLGIGLGKKLQCALYSLFRRNDAAIVKQPDPVVQIFAAIRRSETQPFL